MGALARYRLRARALNRKRKDTERREAYRHTALFKRVAGEIRMLHQMAMGTPQAATETHTVRIILSDLSPQGIRIFSVNPLSPGQLIGLAIDGTRYFYVRARVIWCQDMSYISSRVISQTRYQYRIGLQFVFTNPDESRAVQAYCDQLQEEAQRALSNY